MKKLSSSSTCTNLFRSGLDKAKPAFLRIEPELQAMFDRARKQEPVQIFAKAEDSRDPAVVYAQAKWFESYVKLRVGLQTPLAAAGRFPVARWALLSEESIECIGFHKCISQSPCDSWNRLKSN